VINHASYLLVSWLFYIDHYYRLLVKVILRESVKRIPQAVWV